MNEKTTMIHVRVPTDLKREFVKIAERNSWNASQVLRGAILKFIDDEQRETGKSA